MKYYVVSDVHGFCSILKNTLSEAGFFKEKEPHKLIVLGDLFDRGGEACDVQKFIIELMKKDRVILIKGNHEAMFNTFVTRDRALYYEHYLYNGTYDTALQLTGFDMEDAMKRNDAFASSARKTPYFKKIIPSMLDYYETEHYIFVHGWVPCLFEHHSQLRYYADWRNASEDEWDTARWINGIDAAQTCEEKKTILCGHWHASYGHAKYEHKGSEDGKDADFSPYHGPGVIAIDACVAYSRKINVVILEDQDCSEEVQKN